MPATGPSPPRKCWTRTSGGPSWRPQGTVFARGLRSGPDADLYKLELILGAALNLAQKRIRIVTPYFLPDARLQFAMQQAGLRGVEVRDRAARQKRPAHHGLGDARAVCASSAMSAPAIIATPPPFDHTKLCTVDGEWSLIGSSNWDARSFRLNFEFDLEITDRELTRKAGCADRRQASRGGKQISPDMLADEPLYLKLRNAAARLLMPYL